MVAPAGAEEDNMSDHILQMQSITKRFPGVVALDDVTLSVRRGAIHAICGENGAGKSTLMKVLSGVYPSGSYEGQIHFDGEQVKFSSVRDSEEKGIVIIHQELALVPHLSVAENIFLGNEQSTSGVINWHETNAKAATLLERVGLKENPVTLVGSLGVGKQQLVEIAKALSKNVKLLILDEPTSALNDDDSEHLLDLMRELRDEGVTCIIISHKLGEIVSIADAITVLRDGSTIETIDTTASTSTGASTNSGTATGSPGASSDPGDSSNPGNPTNPGTSTGSPGSTDPLPEEADDGATPAAEPAGPGGVNDGDEAVVQSVGQVRDAGLVRRIIRGMVGRDMEAMYPERDVQVGEEIFRMEDWHVSHPTQQERVVVHGANVNVRAGEVVGIAGLMGAGRTELAMSVFGRSYGRDIRGTILMHGKPVKINSVSDAINHGIAYVSEDRKRYGLNLIEDISRNITAVALKKIAPKGWINGNEEIAVAERYRSSLNIKAPSVLTVTRQLSGGNQQKVALSKWLYSEPELLILDEPTRGIDVGAKYEIYSIINELASAGKAIIVISSELPEILGICDRVYTLAEGRITGELPVAEADQERLMELMTMERE